MCARPPPPPTLTPCASPLARHPPRPGGVAAAPGAPPTLRGGLLPGESARFSARASPALSRAAVVERTPRARAPCKHVHHLPLHPTPHKLPLPLVVTPLAVLPLHSRAGGLGGWVGGLGEGANTLYRLSGGQGISRRMQVWGWASVRRRATLARAPRVGASQAQGRVGGVGRNKRLQPLLGGAGGTQGGGGSASGEPCQRAGSLSPPVAVASGLCRLRLQWRLHLGLHKLLSQVHKLLLCVCGCVGGRGVWRGLGWGARPAAAHRGTPAPAPHAPPHQRPPPAAGAASHLPPHAGGE